MMYCMNTLGLRQSLAQLLFNKTVFFSITKINVLIALKIHDCTCIHFFRRLLSDFINLTQVHNFTVSAQEIFTFRRLSEFTVSFTRI